MSTFIHSLFVNNKYLISNFFFFLFYLERPIFTRFKITVRNYKNKKLFVKKYAIHYDQSSWVLTFTITDFNE